MLLLKICTSIWAFLMLIAATTASMDGNVRCIMYLTGQHDIVPSAPGLVNDVTHVILAFMRSEVFTPKQPDEPSTDFPLFTTVDEARSKFRAGTKVMVAIGGWGDYEGFEKAARDQASRKRWAARVREMVDVTGADGVDIDWEYPGGNRDDYKQIPNSEREWEVDAFVQLLQELRAALGREKLLSIAGPGLERDLMAFTELTVPRIVKEVDFISVMTYDLMNRRDTAVKHHSGVGGSRASIQRYVDRGTPPHMLNLGLGYYVKAFMTESDCDPDNPVGCPTQPLEDPKTGADLGRTAGFSWHDKVPEELALSFQKALAGGKYYEDEEDGGFGYWDAAEQRWWSFDTPDVIASRKLPEVVGPMGLGGVFAWGLGEDAPEFAHLRATVKGVRALRRQRQQEVRDEL